MDGSRIPKLLDRKQMTCVFGRCKKKVTIADFDCSQMRCLQFWANLILQTRDGIIIIIIKGQLRLFVFFVRNVVERVPVAVGTGF